jgi:hypothetical protein
MLMVSYPRIWAIGNLDILETRLVGFFYSGKCTGKAIVQPYDLSRALRDSGIPVIGGFHSPMERECLDLLLRGAQPIALCPARNIERMRLPAAWRTPIAEGRMLSYRHSAHSIADRPPVCRSSAISSSAPWPMLP